MTAISGATVGAVSAGSAACSGKMLKLLFTLVVLTSLLTPQPVISIQVLPDGGYSGIVIKISQDVPEENCADILQKIQVSYNIYTRTAGYSSYTRIAAGYSYTKCLSFILSFYVAWLDMVRIL